MDRNLMMLIEYAAFVVEPDVSSDEHNNAFESDDSSTEGFGV